MSRRKYNHEFKMSAVKLVTEQGYSPLQASKSLGVDPSTIRYWVKKQGNQTGPPLSSEAALRAEWQPLRRENAKLLMERDICPLVDLRL